MNGTLQIPLSSKVMCKLRVIVCKWNISDNYVINKLLLWLISCSFITNRHVVQ